MANDLRDFLHDARARPALYVRDHSLEELETLCYGYSAALANHGLIEFGVDFNQRFRNYLWDRYEWSMSSGWAYGITANVSGNREVAWRRFFELLDEFEEADQQKATGDEN